MVDGNLTEAKNCTYTDLLPTTEEARDGKIFSCTCGGGDDLTSPTACAEQLGTAWDWIMKGSGVAGDEIRMEATAYRGTHRQVDLYGKKDWLHKYPDIFKYDSPHNWDANITGCTISTGDAPKRERRRHNP